MIPEYKEQIAVRLSSEQRQQCGQLIQNGKAKNLSDLIRKAVAEYLDTR